MKPLGVISTAVLFLLLGISLPAFAEEGQEEKGEGKAQESQHEQQPQQAQQKQQKQDTQQAQRGQKQEQQAQQAQQKQQKQDTQQAQRGQKQEQQAQQAQQKQDTQQAQRGQQQEQQQAQQAQQKQQKQDTQQAQRGQQQAGGGQYVISSQQSGRYSGRGGHIPDDRFRAQFGREHRFHIDRAYIVPGGYSRFQYGGFWFGMYDPWPPDWYYTDDIYVDYEDGGYYLYSPMHPGVRISIMVVL